MNLYIKTNEDYEIEQRTSYSKIKYKYTNNEIPKEKFFYKNTNITEDQVASLSKIQTLTKELLDDFFRLAIKKIILPENIHTISEKAFDQYTDLEEIILPQKLQKIEQSQRAIPDFKNMLIF